MKLYNTGYNIRADYQRDGTAAARTT